MIQTPKDQIEGKLLNHEFNLNYSGNVKMELCKQDQQVKALADCAELAIFASELAQAIAYTNMSYVDVKQVARRIDALSRAISEKIDSTADVLFEKVATKIAS